MTNVATVHLSHTVGPTVFTGWDSLTATTASATRRTRAWGMSRIHHL